MHLLVLVVLLGLPAANACAARLSLSSSTFRIISGPGEREGTIICPLTLEGSFHSRTLAKVANSLIGYITRASLNEGLCTGGRATYLRETLPWHLQYAGFSGTLPNIASIGTKIIGLSYVAVEPPFEMRCLYRTTAETPGIGIWSREVGGRIINFRFGENERIRGSCGFERNLIGSTPGVTELGSTTAITLTLI
jgi:hypothetical protein